MRKFAVGVLLPIIVTACASHVDQPARLTVTDQKAMKVYQHAEHRDHAQDEMQAGDLEAAEAKLTANLAAKPDSVGCLLNLATVMERQGRAEEAKIYYARVLALRDDPLVMGMGPRPVSAKMVAAKNLRRLN